MARNEFFSGVTEYVKGETVVTVYFPVDKGGSPHIACRYCQFLASNDRTCQLTKQPVEFPEKYIGGRCPLNILPAVSFANADVKSNESEDENK